MLVLIPMRPLLQVGSWAETFARLLVIQLTEYGLYMDLAMDPHERDKRTST